jgi:hypothetical protein
LAAAFYRLSLPLSAQVRTERSQQLIISLLLLCYSLLKCPGLGYTLLSHFLTVPVVCLVSITWLQLCNRQGLLEDALRVLQKSIHLDNSNPKALAQRILLYQRAERYVEALSALEEMEGVTAEHDQRGRQMLGKMKSFLREKLEPGDEDGGGARDEGHLQS